MQTQRCVNAEGVRIQYLVKQIPYHLSVGLTVLRVTIGISMLDGEALNDMLICAH